VLVVEDVDTVRAFAVRVLERAGHAVLEAREGNGAVAHVESHRGPLDIIVTNALLAQGHAEAQGSAPDPAPAPDPARRSVP
jgi:CheY-like chemotaxis protein